jgi:putative endonuclease
MVTLYVLKGDNGKRYVGITNDLNRRLQEHRNKGSKGGQVIGSFRLLLTEKYPDYTSARLREKFLKSGKGREWLDTFEGWTRSAIGG